MPLTLKAIFILIVLSLTGCARPVTDFPGAEHSEIQGELRQQLGAVADQHVNALRRMYQAAAPIFIANAPLCPRRSLSLGFSTISGFDLPNNIQNAAFEKSQLGNDTKVLGVASNSQAWDLGVHPGDTLVLLNGKQVRNSADWRARIRKLDGTQITHLGLIRDGRAYEVSIHPVPICNYRLIFENENQVINAYADGNSIALTQGMMTFANDEELQLVIGHELAHNIMHHGRKKESNWVTVQVLGQIIDTVVQFSAGGKPVKTALERIEESYSPQFEKEADYIGLYLNARAGQNIDGAAQLERRLGVADGASGMLPSPDPFYIHTHPQSPERAVIQGKTIAEIHAKQDKGRDLMPNLRTPWVFGQKYSYWDVDEEDPWIDSDLNH